MMSYPHAYKIAPLEYIAGSAPAVCVCVCVCVCKITFDSERNAVCSYLCRYAQELTRP